MKKLSDRLQALIADGEIPLSDAWGKLIDDMKAIEEQEPVVVTDDMAYAFHNAFSDSSLGDNEVEEIKTGLRAALANFTTPPVPGGADREMLKRLAIIMSGSDSGGEIAALTVTAQSLVDRCKTLVKERDDARADRDICPACHNDPRESCPTCQRQFSKH